MYDYNSIAVETDNGLCGSTLLAWVSSKYTDKNGCKYLGNLISHGSCSRHQFSASADTTFRSLANLAITTEACAGS